MEARADSEIVAAVRSGDPDAFGALFDRHQGRVYAHCCRQLGTTTDADDMTATVFLEAWRNRDRLHAAEGSALPWLLVTATNVCRNKNRSRRRYQAALDKLPDPEPVPDHADDVVAGAALRGVGSALAAALDTLGNTDRQLVGLCLIEDCTYAQAAEVLGLSHAAVRQRLHRLRARLREQLGAVGIVGSGANDER